MMLSPAQRLHQVGEYYFSKKMDEVRRLNAEGRDVINLGIGSPDLEPAPEAIASAIRHLQMSTTHGYASYRSTPELRSAISRWYQKTYGVASDPATQVLPLLGSKEGLMYVSMAFLNPGDKALVPNPGYPAYASVTRLAGATPVFYDLKEENDWLPDFAALEKANLEGVKLMWANFPNMPTGRAANENLFEKLIDFGRRKRILICHDNPYSLVLNESSPLSILRFDPAMQVSLELNSFSKSFSMAGWRVGMLLASGEVVDTVIKVKSNVDSGMFLPVQMAAVSALDVSDEWHASRNLIYRERRDLAFQIFDRLDFQYRRDQVGLFVWAKAPSTCANVERLFDELLQQAGVFLTPGFVFGSNGERYGRCSLCAPRERLREALLRVERYI